jgi:LVIVD repeat
MKQFLNRMAAALTAAALLGQPLAAKDRLEPGLQGQTAPSDKPGAILAVPYSKGVRVVGHNTIGGRDSNIQMAWVGHCAYVSTTSPKFLGWGGQNSDPAVFGVAVIDVRNPKSPKNVGLLRGRGSLYASETLHAVEAEGRKILVAGSYGAKDDAAYTDIYDVSDCANPKLLTEWKWPQPVHTLTLSPDGNRIYGPIISPFDGKGGIAVTDISDLSHPRFIGKFEATRPDGTSYEFAPHELSISPDETRLYVGVIGSRGDDLNKGVTAPFPSVETFGPEAGGIYIFDNSDIAQGRPDPKLRLIGTAQHGGWHSVMRANIGGVPHLVGGTEGMVCPSSWPKIVSIADERNPVVVSSAKLAMNNPENCAPDALAAKGAAAVLPPPGTATLHFNDVDSATDTRLGLFNFMWAGLRIFDIRKPANPVEVAYFKPGDGCSGHVRYVPETGHIWLSCGASGFYVLELDRKLRKTLGYKRK